MPDLDLEPEFTSTRVTPRITRIHDRLAVLMYLIWHARYQQDPAHRWLRAQLEAVVAPALAHDALT